MTTLLSHTLIALALIAAYAVLTALGHDANQLLVILGGYAGGVAVTATTSSTSSKPL